MRLSPSRALVLALAAGTLLTSPAFSQDSGHARFDAHRAATAWAAQAGPDWSLRLSPERGNLAHLFGGSIAYDVDGSDVSFESAARQAVGDLRELLGFDADSLRLDQVKHLALSRIGSSDKVNVRLTQTAGGVDVSHGFLNVLFSMDGRLLSLDNQALAEPERIDIQPTVSVEQAADVARAAFGQDTGLGVDSIEFLDYQVVQHTIWAGKAPVEGVAAHTFRVAAPFNPASGATPVIRTYAIAATGTPRVLDSWSNVHNADLTGNVQGFGQGGLLPDGQGPDDLLTLKDVRLSASGQPVQFSADDGSFTFPNVNSTKTVTATLKGQYATVTNLAGADASIPLSVSPGAPVTFTFNSGLTEQQTAEVNAHYHVNVMRDFIRSIDPSDTTFDFPVVAKVNTNATCNAFYDGVSINFYLAGGGCANTGYSNVIYHENGHWANDLYGSGNGFDGFGEGAADVWAMYISDDPIVGNGFFGPGTNIRTGLNTRQFCGDANPGCYGEVHNDGEVLMGALWKVRANLEASQGQTAGGNIANAIMLAWFQAFDDGQIKSIVEEHWLVLDDDDGDLANGTPHSGDIVAGFVAQGFPPFVPPLFSFSHTPLTTLNSEGPADISVDITSSSSTVAAARVLWSTDGANFNRVSLSPAGGNTYTGQIPGQTSPAIVSYFIEAESPSGVINSLPADGAAAPFVYDVGTLVVHESYDFEAAGDQGWTHVQIATQDDWQRGVPQGKSTDPSNAVSGVNVWGNDLGPSGFNGAYQPNVVNRLITPSFNLSGKTDTRLRIQRWLNVEKSQFDHARILVNGTMVWENPFATDLLDSAWKSFDLDISSIADNNASVQVIFELTSDGGLEFGGWNIDDFRIVSLGPVSGTPFIEYGSGLAGTGGVTPHLAGSGNAVQGGTVTLTLDSGLANTLGALFLGSDRASIPFKGGAILVLFDLGQTAAATDGLGGAVLSATLPHDPVIVGFQLDSQMWLADPGAIHGASSSNGLEFVVQ